MSSPGRRRPPGEIRQSQVITTFGPGAMMDLPNHSVLMGGLDYWFPLGEEIAEPRLAAKLCRLLDLPAVHLRLPPADQEDPAAPRSGIKAWHFPEWCITRDVRLGADQPHVRSRRLVHRRTLQNGRFVDDNRQRHTVVPVRFVRACKAGHISDIDWYRYVHTEPTECRRPLWMDERGTSGDLAEVYVRCECGQERSMAQAAVLRTLGLGPVRWGAALARALHARNVRGAESVAHPHGEQCLLSANHARHFAPGPQRGRQRGGGSGLGVPGSRRGW